jgi:hypothetical protein
LLVLLLERWYFDVVALISGLEDDFLELLHPLSGTCVRIGTEVVYSFRGVDMKSPMFFVFLIHFSIHGIAEVDSPAWKVEILQLEENRSGDTAGSS